MNPAVEQTQGKIVEFLVAIILLIGSIFLFEPFININKSILIALIVIIFAFVWMRYLSFSRYFLMELKKKGKTIFPNQANEINLLLTSGFFGVVISHTFISRYISNIWAG